MSIESENNCCICLEETLNINVSVTICSHIFHTSCLLKYGNNKCPICRQLLYNEETITIKISEIITEIEDVETIENLEQSFITEEETNITLIDLYFTEINKINLIKNIIRKIIRCVSQIYISFFLIFCIRILTNLLWMVIYEIHLQFCKYLFE